MASKIINGVNQHSQRERERPVVTRFLCPPETPLNMSFPTTVSEHISRPRTFKT